MRKIMNTISVITFALAFTMMGVYAFWTLHPYKVLQFNEGNGIIDAKQVVGGQYIEIHQNQCKLMDLPGTVNRQFIDGIIYQVPTVIANRPVGCHQTIEKIYVPKVLPSGMFKIRTTISYKVNPTRTITYTVTSNEFKVINPSD